VALEEADFMKGEAPDRNPDEMRKLSGILRYSQGTVANGFSLAGMAYSNRWNSTDQVPLRAIQSGEIGLYGAIDPSDGGKSSSSWGLFFFAPPERKHYILI
jgi:hypothetical protein